MWIPAWSRQSQLLDCAKVLPLFSASPQSRVHDYLVHQYTTLYRLLLTLVCFTCVGVVARLPSGPCMLPSRLMPLGLSAPEGDRGMPSELLGGLSGGAPSPAAGVQRNAQVRGVGRHEGHGSD